MASSGIPMSARPAGRPLDAQHRQPARRSTTYRDGCARKKAGTVPPATEWLVATGQRDLTFNVRHDGQLSERHHCP